MRCSADAPPRYSSPDLPSPKWNLASPRQKTASEGMKPPGRVKKFFCVPAPAHKWRSAPERAAPERLQFWRFGRSCRSPSSGTTKLKLRRPRRSPSAEAVFFIRRPKNATASERAEVPVKVLSEPLGFSSADRHTQSLAEQRQAVWSKQITLHYCSLTRYSEKKPSRRGISVAA